MDDNGRPHSRRIMLWMGAYVLAIVAEQFVISGPPRPDAAHLAAAIVPLVPLFFALAEIVRGIRAMDELQRRIQIEGLLLALLGTAAIVLGVGLLQMIAGIPTFTVFWLWAPLCLLYALGVWLGKRRYA